MSNQWMEINNQNDIEHLMNITHSFHDSCLKEFKYLSGMYVNKDGSMAAINNKRQIHLIIQSQSEPNVIEMIFEKILCMSLKPTDETYDGIIMNSHIAIENDYFVWFDNSDFKENYQELYNSSLVTYIKAKKIKWRINNKHIGKDDVFIEANV